MGHFKELEIEQMAFQERKRQRQEERHKQIRFEVEQMFSHLKSAQAQLRSIRKPQRRAVGAGQGGLLHGQARRDVSGF